MHLTNHTLTIINRFGNSITALVVYIKPLGKGQAEVHVETNFYLDEGHDQPATSPKVSASLYIS